jgi:putative ABC transport system substrate-binding protein
VNNRRKLVIALGAGAIAASLTSMAQTPTGIARIGYLNVFARSVGALQLKAFTQGLEALGYVEGKTFVVEPRWAEGNRERLPALAAELVAAHVDVIVAGTGQSAIAAKGVTSTIPIVMSASSDAVPQGIVTSLGRPGGNVTGLTALSSELAPKRLQLLKELLPRLRKVTVLWCHPSPINEMELGNVQAAAVKLNLELQPIKYTGTPASWKEATRAIERNRPDALFLLDCTTLPFQEIVNLSLAQRIPMMGQQSFLPDMGGLLAYGPDLFDMSRRAATFVDKILKGTKPAEIPVELPLKFELAINMKTAKTLGIKIPNSILVRATKVIE